MCAPDPNAGIRMQARIENKKKHAKFYSESLKFWNREAAAKQRKGALTTGLSRTRSDAYSKALYTLGKGRQANAKLYSAGAAKLSRYDQKTGVGRSRRFMAGKYKAILDKQAQIESTIDATFGRNMDVAWQGILRNHQNKVAKNRESIGVRPEFGVPVFLPPKDRMGQMFSNISTMLSIASLAVSFSDIKLKENIEEVGKSPKGYKIYEWNYKADKNTRYRGVIAQDVVAINPMAVGIRDNYLTVDYRQVDVDMEIVS